MEKITLIPRKVDKPFYFSQAEIRSEKVQFAGKAEGTCNLVFAPHKAVEFFEGCWQVQERINRNYFAYQFAVVGGFVNLVKT